MNDYGLYKFNIKYYGFESEYEIEEAQRWAFGEHMPLSTNSNRRGFEGITELLGRPIESYTAGRSSGWLTIHTELTKSELKKVEKFVAQCLKALPEFLKEERAYRQQEKEDAERQEKETAAALAVDIRVTRIKELVKDVAGSDAVLVMKGIKVL